MMPKHLAFIFWIDTIAAVLAWPLFVRVAVTHDWTVIFVPFAISAMVVMLWLALRREYGTFRCPPRTQA